MSFLGFSSQGFAGTTQRLLQRTVTGAAAEDAVEEEELDEEEELGEVDEMADFIVDEEEVDKHGEPSKGRRKHERVLRVQSRELMTNSLSVDNEEIDHAYRIDRGGLLAIDEFGKEPSSYQGELLNGDAEFSLSFGKEKQFALDERKRSIKGTGVEWHEARTSPSH